MAVPNVKLSSGFEMPLVGFGLWKVNNETCADQVYHAIKAGYRLFDGACGTLTLPKSKPLVTVTHTINFRLRQRGRSRPGCGPRH